MDGTIARLADYASSLTFDELPGEIVDIAVVRLVDSLGCAVGALGSEQARISREVSPRLSGDVDVPGLVLGVGWVTSPEFAALANTCMIRNLDFNDRYPHVHPSDMIGGLLAGVGAPGVDGKRLVTAIVTAYEVATRIADATDMHHGWDSGYAAGLGGVAGIANLLGCDANVTGQALSLIATANVAFRATRYGELSLWKGAATAYSMFNAMLVTRLAQRGMTGPDQPIEGRHGLWEKITGQFELDEFPRAGGEYNIKRTSLKFWPVEFSAQASVWAGKRLAQSIPIEELASVRLGAHKHGWHEIASEPVRWDPHSRESADHSMPYLFVRAMQNDGVDLDIFEPDSYLDPAARPLMAKVTVEVDDECDAVHPDSEMLKVDAVATDGHTESFAIRDPRGFWSNPLAPSEVEAKFLRLTEPVYGADRSSELFQYWSAVTDKSDLTAGMRLFDTDTDGGHA